jgi:hypothetical protein
VPKILSFVLAFLLVLTVNFSAAPAYADEKLPQSQTVTVEGEAAIIDSAEVAENAALAAALRSAVEQATGVYVLSETKVSNFQTLSDEIYTKAEGFVSEHEIIKKEIRKDTVWLKVSARVSLEPLVESLKKLGLLRKWTVAVVLAPGAEGQDSGSEYTEAAVTSLNEAILESGFRVVDRDIIASLEKPEILRQIIAGNYLAASGILKDNGVDVLIVGKAYSEEVSGSNYDAYGVNVYLASARGRLEAKLVRADTGELLATKTFEGAGVGAGKDVRANALKSSGTDAGKYFAGQIMKLPASTFSYIQLMVKGLTFSKAKEFMETLKTVRGVRKVTNRGFRNKEALYEVESDGDVNLLADNMSENKQLKNTFKFDITTVSSGKIEASGN